ncbi:MAG TPA: glycosyltransferase family 9 protein [Gemmatimonadaceae bacterium]|nr:glycosyltransferase family 9 protein [Gemmatimonadaceae bacterium]
MSDFRLDRICIVMMSAVGDAVHVLPVANAIKRHRPQSHVTWILQAGPARLVRGHPSVDEIILFERGRGWEAFTDIRTKLASTTFDVVLALQVYFKAGIVTAFTRAPVKLGFDRARARDLNWLFTNRRIPSHPTGQHVQDQYFEFLHALGIPAAPVVWNLGPWEHERAWQQAFFAPIDRPVASIVVATSKPEKDWPPERWAEVIDALYEDHGLQPVLVGGTSPREMAAQAVITARARHTPLTTLGASLRELVAILEGSALVLTPDTGPLHMAVAVGTPVISLIGYTNPRRTGPYRRFHDLIVDAYGDPGEDYPISIRNRPGRMERIGVRDVMEKVQLWRERYANHPRQN